MAQNTVNPDVNLISEAATIKLGATIKPGATLHQLMSNQPSALTQLLTMIQPNDGVLLVADGCYRIKEVSALDKDNSVYALKADIDMRGLTAHSSANTKVMCITDDEWVALTLAYARTASWIV
ncbi:MAG: DsrH/TusB family sulfur metabolism protein [Oleibacter sp.]|nr:DsrH/TusB family sulfur metabolism protein [Thalassolituus sp.]